MATSFTLQVQQDEEDGDCYLQFPTDFLESQDWREGDKVDWTEVSPGDPSKGFSLVNLDKRERKAQAEGQKIFIVETVISHRVRYAIRGKCAGDATDEVVCEQGRLNDFDQNCLGEQIFSVREVSEEEFLGSFEVPADRSMKLGYIKDIDYK